MTIKLENPLRLRVALDQPELLEYGLTFERLDYEKDKTKQLLNALLIKATRTTDFRLYPGRLMIEAFPAQNGGCVIYFTISRERGRVFRRKSADEVFLFASSNDLLDAIKAAYISRAEHTSSELYRFGDEWRLAVKGISRKAEAILREFSLSFTADRAFFAETKEHSRLICANAIKTIGPYYI